MVMWTVSIKFILPSNVRIFQVVESLFNFTLHNCFFFICWVHTLHNISLGRISNKAYHLQNACMRSDAENDDLKFPLLSHWLSVVADFQSKHAARLWGCIPVRFLFSSLANFPSSCLLGCMPLVTLHECTLLAEPLQWAELERPEPLITYNPLWSWIMVYIFLFINLFGAAFSMYIDMLGLL